MMARNISQTAQSGSCSNEGRLHAERPLDADQIQPASLDLRLGSKAFRVRASFLPGPSKRVADKLDRLKLHVIDLAEGAVLETGCVYIVPLIESLDLPADTVGLGQSEELDRPARYLHPRHHRLCAGIRQDPGRLYRAALSRNLARRRSRSSCAAARACRRSASATASRCCGKTRCWRCTWPRRWLRAKRPSYRRRSSRCRSTSRAPDRTG